MAGWLLVNHAVVSQPVEDNLINWRTSQPIFVFKPQNFLDLRSRRNDPHVICCVACHLHHDTLRLAVRLRRKHAKRR